MPKLHVDLLRVFLVALLTIGGIKLTSLLPAGYYFSFAQAYTDELGSLIVPRPVLALRQQCKLERAQGLTFRDCDSILDDDTVETGKGPSPDQQAERERQASIKAAIDSQVPFTKEGQLELSASMESDERSKEELIDEIAASLLSPGGLEATLDEFVWVIADEPLHDLEEEAEKRFKILARPGGVTPSASGTADPSGDGQTTSEDEEPSDLEETGEDDEEDDDASEPSDSDQAEAHAAATEDERLRVAQRVFEAREKFVAALRALPPIRVSPVSLQEAEEALDASEDEWLGGDVEDDDISTIFARPEQDVLAVINPIYDQTLREANLNIEDKKQKIDLIAAGMNLSYIAALLIRLAVPFVVAFVFVLATGDWDRRSISVGTAFAAFLLAWPVAVMWSTIVDPAYYDLRPTFIAFYITYTISFLTMGFLGSSVAQRLRGISVPVAAAGRLGAFRKFAVSLPSQVGINIVANVLTVSLSYLYFGRDVIS